MTVKFPDDLDDFAASQGAKTWKDYPNPENWKSTVLNVGIVEGYNFFGDGFDKNPFEYVPVSE
ncbi:hypothetical protein [Paenibacillus sanfengchensis]|uniref:hypothetical protein n=1 Tax=Paenibacillus sanfengchensis TaxID=3119819 RepID=UPI002FE0C8B8